MDRLESARQFRKELDANMKVTRQTIKPNELTEVELDEMIDLYDQWKVGIDVEVGEFFKDDGNLFEVIQAHKTQADWKPISSLSLFKPVMPAQVIPYWVQPTMAENAYNIGDKVIHSGIVYESTINANTWSPTEYPSGWIKV